MSLTAHILEIVTTSPGISTLEVVALFPAGRRKSVSSTLSRLHKNEFIHIVSIIPTPNCAQRQATWAPGSRESADGGIVREGEFDYAKYEKEWQRICAALSSNGRTVDFGSTSGGSTPPRAST